MMGRADLLLGFGGLHLVLALVMAVVAMWIGRQDRAVLIQAARLSPLEMQVLSEDLPMWRLALLGLRRFLLPAQVVLIGLVLGWGGLFAGVVGAIALWGYGVARAQRMIYEGHPASPLEGGFGGFVTRALVELGLTVLAYVSAYSALVFIIA